MPTKKKPTKKAAEKFPVALLVKGKPCGCRAGMAGIVYADCEHHLRLKRENHERAQAYKKPNPFANKPEPSSSQRPEILDNPKYQRAFKAELRACEELQDRKMTEALWELGIPNPEDHRLHTTVKKGKKTTYKSRLTPKQHDALASYMHKFAFTTEQIGEGVRAEMK